MAYFILLTGPHGFEHINLDLVRRITEDTGDGSITLHFDCNHTRKFEGNDARTFMNEVNRHWQKAKAMKRSA
jgi:hypothetical protein